MLKSWGRASVVVVLAAVLCVCGWAAERAGLQASGQLDAMRREFETALGVRIEFAGLSEVHLFPRPYVSATDVRISDAAGSGSLDIPVAKASLALGPLLLGRVVIDRATILDPTGTIDLDALATRWSVASTQTKVAVDWPTRLPSRLVIASGLINVRSTRTPLSGFLTDLQFAVSAPSSGIVTLNGRGGWHGTPIELTAQIDRLGTFVGGEPTSGFLRAKSNEATLSVNGTLRSGWHGGLNGSVATSTPALPGLLRTLGLSTFGLAGVRHASFRGSAESTEDGLSFSDVRLVLNTTVLEGALALQQDGGLVGTLATDVLDLAPFVAEMPPALARDGEWNRDAMNVSASLLRDLDLRISANRLLMGDFHAEDAALSALSRDGRMELSLGEARAYGGLIKARLLASLSDHPAHVRVDGSASRLNLDQLTGLFHLQPGQITGSATAHLGAEGRGDSVEAIVSSAEGRFQIGIRQGRVAGLPLFEGVLKSQAETVREAPPSEPAPFDLVTLAGALNGGVAVLGESAVDGPAGHLLLRGRLSLVDGGYSLSSAPAPDEGPTAFEPPDPTGAGLGEAGRAPGVRAESQAPARAPAAVSPNGYFP